MPTGHYWWRQCRVRLIAGTLIGAGIVGLALPAITPIPFGVTVTGASLCLVALGTLILVLSDSSP